MRRHDGFAYWENNVTMRNKLVAAATATAVSAGLSLVGATLTSPAEAAVTLTPTDYGFQGTAYGTRVRSEVAGLESTRTAFSYISCTRIAGLKDEESLASTNLPADNPLIQVTAVDSRTRTFKDRQNGIAAAMVSTNSIGSVELGSTDTPKLVIEGLRTRSMAWATTGDQLRADNEISSVNIDLLDLPPNEEIPDELEGPLQELIAAAEGGIGEVLQAILDNSGLIVIPGLGEVSVGFDRVVEKRAHAQASSFVLRVLLYGQDQAKDGGDDSLVGIGRSWARINRNLPAAVMGGWGYGSNAEVLDGVVTVGKLGEQVLPCPGTRGEVFQSPSVGFGPTDQFSLAGLRGRSFGEQSETGAAQAWTEGSAGNLVIGPLEIRGIVGRVNLAQNRNGKITRNDFAGSVIGEIVVDGESQGQFGPADAGQIPADQLPPGVLSIELFDREKLARGGRISAVVVTFADGTPGVTTLRLGNAQARLKRY